MPRTLVLCLAFLFALTGCSSMKPQDFAGTTPTFALEDYFDGKVRAWGIFQDRFGRLRRQFVVDITGTWDGETLTLVEDFVYDDGELDQRIWHIRKLDEHRYEGTADDVVGTAVGIAYGNALNWSYDFDLLVGERRIRVRFDDWMFLQDQEVMINRAEVIKWGFTLGEVSIFFTRQDQDDIARQTAAAAEAAE
ncbi:MAG: DUF3833 domain-containing protein [Inquilinus sp.]|nr:DUF3833 domain-containing protein [Inquilinus sp.]